MNMIGESQLDEIEVSVSWASQNERHKNSEVVASQQENPVGSKVRVRVDRKNLFWDI